MYWSGLAIFCLMIVKNYVVKMSLPHNALLNTLCTVVAASLMSGCLFLSLRGVMVEYVRRRHHFGISLAAGCLLLLMFLTNYYPYVFIIRQINKFEDAPNMFPALVETIQNDKTGEHGQQLAQMTYQMYGTRVAYRRNANDWTYYVPSAEDAPLREEIEKMNSSLKNLRSTSMGLLNGAVDVVLSVFLTFLLGLFWLAFRRLEPDQVEPAPSVTPHL